MTSNSKKTRDWKLINKIMEHSNGQSWDDAKAEWTVIDYYEKDDSTCVCGKEHISHCHTIQNIYTGDIIGPIGSNCIEKFDSMTMNDDMSLTKTFVQLDDAFKNFVEIDDIRTLLRNRKLMTNLLDNNVFKSEEESTFYGKMIRKTTPMTERQEKWMRKLIFFDVKPYIQEQIKDYKTHISSKSDKLTEQDDSTLQSVLSLGETFKQPTMTLRDLYPKLAKPEVLSYFQDHKKKVFTDEKNATFFNSIMTKKDAVSEKQVTWLKSVISKQIKPFVLDKVKEFQSSLTLSDADLDFAKNQTDKIEL